MDMIENPMVMPEYTFKSRVIPDDVLAEMEDRRYEDNRDNNFEEDL